MKSEKQTHAGVTAGGRAVSATQAARTFSDLLNRVQYRGERFIIERGGAPVGELGPVTPHSFTGTDLVHLLEALPPPDGGFARDVMSRIRRQPRVGPSLWETEGDDEG